MTEQERLIEQVEYILSSLPQEKAEQVRHALMDGFLDIEFALEPGYSLFEVRHDIRYVDSSAIGDLLCFAFARNAGEAENLARHAIAECADGCPILAVDVLQITNLSSIGNRQYVVVSG